MDGQHVEDSVDLYADLLEDKTCTPEKIPRQEKPSPSIDETSRLTTLDLYDDLITTEGLQKENSHQELNDKYKAALDTIGDLERQLEAAKRQEAFYVEKCQTLEKNISLLYVTAKAELQRKDSQIEELRKRPKYQRQWRKPNFHEPVGELAKEDSHTRSNGHSVSGSVQKDAHQRPETRKSPRKRKCLSSWEDTRENFKKRSKKEESSDKTTEPRSSCHGIQFHSEKSRDGLISARKLVEKSIKDLRNRRSNEFKRNAKDHSVIKKDFSGIRLVNSECVNVMVTECNEQPSKPSEVGTIEDSSYHNESEISIKGLIDNQKNVKKNQKEVSLQRAVVSDKKTKSRESEHVSSKTKHRLSECSPSNKKREKEGRSNERHGRYSEKKESDRKEWLSQDKEENRRKGRQSTRQQKGSSEVTESSRKKSDRGDFTDSRLKDVTGIKDLRSKLTRNKRQGSDEYKKDLSSDKEVKRDRDSKRAKKCRLDMSDCHKDKGSVTSGKKLSSAKPDLSQVREKAVGSSSIEEVWSKVNANSSKNSQETITDKLVNEPMSSSKGNERNEMLKQTEWTEKKSLTPKAIHKPIEQKSAVTISNVEEAMVRVNEEKIIKYREASNNEVKALTEESNCCREKGLVKAREKCGEVGSPFEENQKDIHSNRAPEMNQCDKNPTSLFKCPNSAQNISRDKDISSVFIEELLSMDENCRDIYNEKYDENDGKGTIICEREGNKDAESYIPSGPEAQDGSLSCFDVKLHVSEKEIKDLLGNEDSLSESINIAKQDLEKKSRGDEKRGSSARYPSKCSSTVDKKTDKKSSTREKRSSVDKKKENEPASSKAVLKLPLGSRNVFSESVFENTKPVSVKENVYTSSKGTKIVLKSESLKAVKKTVPKNSLSKKEYDADREFLSQLKRKYAKEDLKNVSKHGSQKKESAVAASAALVKDKDLLISECPIFDQNSAEQRKLTEECQVPAVCIVQSEISPISQLGETTTISNSEKLKNDRDNIGTQSAQDMEGGHSKDEIKQTRSDGVSVEKDVQPLEEQRETSMKDNTEDRVRKCENSTTISSGKNMKDSKESTSVIQTAAKISYPVSKQDSIISGNFCSPLSEPIEMEAVPSVQTTISGTAESRDEKTTTTNTTASTTTGLTNDKQSCTEPMESIISVLQTNKPSSLVSIDFIRSNILKKIEERKIVCSDSSVNSVTENNKDASSESNMNVTGSQKDQKTEQPTNSVSHIKRCSPKIQTQDDKVQSMCNFKPPVVELEKQNVCRDLHTETESITEFFDEESQLDLNGAVSLRAKDGIDVRRQSFEKLAETEEQEQGIESSSVVDEMETDVVGVHESDVLTLQDSEAEEGEVHSSDTENNADMDMDKFVSETEKTGKEPDVKDKEQGRSRSRSSHSSRGTSKSVSKEKERIEVDKPQRRNTSGTDRSVRTQKRGSQRIYDSKEDRKHRDSRSKEKAATSSSSRSSRERSKERSSVSSSRERSNEKLSISSSSRRSRERSKERPSASSSGRSREKRIDDRNSESKSPATSRHRRESKDSKESMRYPKSRLSNTEVMSARLERFRDLENSRSRHNSSDAKSDRNSSYRSGLVDSETKLIHRESTRSTREDNKSVVKRK